MTRSRMKFDGRGSTGCAMAGVEVFVDVIGILFYYFASCYELQAATSILPASVLARKRRRNARPRAGETPALQKVAPSEFNKVALVSSHFGMLQFLCSLSSRMGTEQTMDPDRSADPSVAQVV